MIMCIMHLVKCLEQSVTDGRDVLLWRLQDAHVEVRELCYYSETVHYWWETAESGMWCIVVHH